MWSAALDIILTTLRYLAPATLLTLFWGQQSFIFKLLKHIDSAFRAIVFSSEEQKQAVLQWLAEAGPVRVEHLDTVWRHGWILCGVLDAALPGACAGHPPTRLSLKHAQAIADHYLGVEPVFTRQELESNDSLSKHQEWKLATYLDRIRQALSKLTPPVSKPPSQRTSPETTQFTLDYVARGSGLTAAQVHNKMYFKIYPTSQQSLDPGEITILIRGPKDTYGMTVLPPIPGKAQLIRQKLLGLHPKPNYTENALPLTQGTAYLRSYGKNDMNKIYHIPKSTYDIDIENKVAEDHAKIGYIVYLEGKHEISITSKGRNIVGSPFKMTASKNIIGILERDSSCLEDGEEIDIVDIKTDRKVVLRIVDFVTEKMLLKENGSLEKISDEEARILMATESVTEETPEFNFQTSDAILMARENDKAKRIKFKSIANKVIKMNRICKIISDLVCKNESPSRLKEENYIRPRSHKQDIPDIVNSTFTELNYNPFVLMDKRDKVIIPQNISVSLQTEKSTTGDTETTINKPTSLTMQQEISSHDSLDTFESLQEQIVEDILVDRHTSPSNPFISDSIEQDYDIEKDLGSFVKTEYETNNSQSEEMSSSIKITIIEDESETPSPSNKNPFVEPDIINLERPKTPILKIITDGVVNRDDSVYIDPKTALISEEEMLGNEFINPFFMHAYHQNDQNVHKLPITDFIIGAPVSLPPIIRAATPEPEMESMLITDNNESSKAKLKDHDIIQTNNSNEISSTLFSTPLHTNLNKCSAISSTFYSFDSNVSDNVEILSLSNASDNQETYNDEASQTNRDLTPKKDMWDSAYVSIDDNNSSPDSNNNDNIALCDATSKQRFSPSDNTSEFMNMGPAERELWQTCTDLKHEAPKICEDVKPAKWEIKRPIFTPIIEESDRSLSGGIKDTRQFDTLIDRTGTEPMSVAFAEPNGTYEPFPTLDNNTANIIKESTRKTSDNTKEIYDVSVNSASEMSDVKRHKEKLEGKISEVQAHVTESVSVSQTLHETKSELPQHFKEIDIQFGNNTHTNIVLEKKQYWDERIREIEAKSEENKTPQRKRRLSSRHLRLNDSLTKRRGKQIVKNFLNSNEHQTTLISSGNDKPFTAIINTESPTQSFHCENNENEQTDSKLVEKWKKYWDSKLEIEKDESNVSCFRTKSPKNTEKAVPPQQRTRNEDDIIEMYKEINEIKTKLTPVKQELPEEIFKAFETSPKRFFGTSRKQILNKIDTFLGKPSTADESSTDVSGAFYDTGLVSSRISLFHNISQTEELSWSKRKCQSMHNISQRKDSEKSTASVDEKAIINLEKQIETENITERNSNKTNATHFIYDKAEPENNSVSSENISLKNKRSRLVQKVNYKTFDETVYKKPNQDINLTTKPTNVKKVINEYNKQSIMQQKHKPIHFLRKTSVSKSEMDIFNKTTSRPTEVDLDKHKSCEELPKFSVKNVISLYENVSKPKLKSIADRKINRENNAELRKHSVVSSSTGAVHSTSQIAPSSDVLTSHERADNKFSTDHPTPSSNCEKLNGRNSTEPKSIDSVDIEIVSNHDMEKETTYMSLSDIELEIIENTEKKSIESTPEREVEIAQTDYKSRFKMAKQFFQSLEELREVKKPKKLNECEALLHNKSNESLEYERPQKRTKKNIKAHSMPSSEISKIWNQLQESQNSNNTKLVKISEKFNVDDLFNDVMEGKLSRQGSLRGIPHKKAVLEAFKSMENLTGNKMSSYELAVSQLHDFADDNKAKTAQTYLSEYPYLPMTDPSKYHSRLDTKATGLISLKELLNQKKPRRNSVPDLRLNTKFSVDL